MRKALVFLGFLALIAPLLLMLTYADYSRAGSGTIEYGEAETVLAHATGMGADADDRPDVDV